MSENCREIQTFQCVEIWKENATSMLHKGLFMTANLHNSSLEFSDMFYEYLKTKNFDIIQTERKKYRGSDCNEKPRRNPNGESVI